MHALLLVAPVLEASIDEVFDRFADSFGALVAFGQAIGFIGSLFYIFYRIWGHWSRAEPFDIYPLLRPFALAICLLFYPFIVKFIVEIGQLLDKGTSTMVASQKAEVERLNQLKKAKVKDNWDKILIPPGEDGEIGTWDVVRTVFGTTGTGNSLVGNAVSGVMQYYFDQFLSWLGEIFYDLSAIYIKLISTFFDCARAYWTHHVRAGHVRLVLSWTGRLVFSHDSHSALHPAGKHSGSDSGNDPRVNAQPGSRRF